MKDLYIKRNELSKNSQYLQTVKFDNQIRGVQVNELIEEQKRVYKKYEFYDNYLKAINKKKEGK